METIEIKGWWGREGLDVVTYFFNDADEHLQRSLRALERSPESRDGFPPGVDTGTKRIKGQIVAKKKTVEIVSVYKNRSRKRERMVSTCVSSAVYVIKVSLVVSRRLSLLLPRLKVC